MRDRLPLINGSIGSKCVSWRKKVGVKLYGIFLETETETETELRNFRFLSKIIPLDFSEILIIFRNYSALKISTDCRM